jgi:hypothetical protein
MENVKMENAYVKLDGRAQIVQIKNATAMVTENALTVFANVMKVISEMTVAFLINVQMTAVEMVPAIKDNAHA